MDTSTPSLLDSEDELFNSFVSERAADRSKFEQNASLEEKPESKEQPEVKKNRPSLIQQSITEQLNAFGITNTSRLSIPKQSNFQKAGNIHMDEASKIIFDRNLFKQKRQSLPHAYQM